MNFTINLRKINELKQRYLSNFHWEFAIVYLAVIFSLTTILWSFIHDYIVAYGDAESHLNIAKRVVQSITPGFAQLGGIWLPLPHLMMVPFVIFDPLWRTGFAGSIVSSFCFLISTMFIYKTMYLLSKNKIASFVAAFIFITNPNILYMQSTPLTELPLIMFFTLSIYYFIRFIKNDSYLFSLIAAAFFGFCATLTRYDGWFLVAIEALAIFLFYIKRVIQNGKGAWFQMEGKILLYATPAFFGILLWFLWDFLILGNALYFTNSEFSAKTQQASWLAKGELPAYHNLFLSIAYYFVTAMSNSGILIFITALIGFISYIIRSKHKNDLIVALVLLTPFIFYIVTLFIGQSVIFIPHLTPVGFEWRLFNVRYGLMAIPFTAIFFAWLFHKSSWQGKLLITFIFLLQIGFFLIGYSPVITWQDGVVGLSHAKRPDAEYWMKAHYDGGLVLLDDYARTMSIIRAGIPMQENIYIGNKPYWEESLVAPERYATWIVMQKNDAVWKALYDNPIERGRLFKYFNKAYTSPEILIFRRIGK